MDLCPKCKALVQFIDGQIQAPPRHPSEGLAKHRFEPIGHDHCPLCHFVQEQLLQSHRDVQVLDISCLLSGNGGVSLGFYAHTGRKYRYLHASITPQDRIHVPSDYTPEAHTDAEATWRMANHWLNACISSHSCQSECPSVLPTRLIQISPGDQGMKLKLVESTGVAPGTKYCTLSHCWGRNEMFTLEQTNYPECLQNIPFEWLTKTFQHAITAATRLGYSYIWIDSLCIIQKDTADWQKEAGTMATVYAQSSLNLAASSASDGQAGMFFPRDPALLQPITISMPSTKIKYSVENPYLWAHSIEDSVLASRGWALQERFLAPRTLHFTTKQLFWECIQGCASESSPTISAQNIFDGHPSIALKGPMPAEMLWDNVVRAYSQTYLSHVADKLIALSGIARAVQARNRDIYLAGMWWTGLETQLLWAVKRTPWMQKRALPAHRLTPKPTRPVEYRAPSWSWAAVDGFISTANERLAGDGVVLISITGSEIVPMHDSDAFGQIKAAYLEVQGEQLKKARVKKGITGSRKICISVKGQWRDLSYILDEEPLTGKEPIYLLLARQHRHPSPAGRPKMFRNEYDILDGLLLTPIEGMAGQYSRLGTWTISGSWGEGLVGAWMGQGVRDLKGFRTLPGVEDSQAYVNVEEDGYKIRLV